uniref:(California timema) hypothetical protein n=1 Tax=Timema californicum TaxID=61474 RepID=A0A7R9IXD8_TIMCA|nr:unnamed protein product [Timema californicum]
MKRTKFTYFLGSRIKKSPQPMMNKSSSAVMTRVRILMSCHLFWSNRDNAYVYINSVRSRLVVITKCTCICVEGEWKKHFENTPFSSPDRDLNLDLPVISSLVYCEKSALNYAATKVGKSESKDSPEKERCEPIPKPKAKTPSKPGDIRLEIKLSIRWDYGKFWVLRTSPQTLENSNSPLNLCGPWATDDK